MHQGTSNKDDDLEIIRRLTRSEPRVVHRVDLSNLDGSQVRSLIRRYKDMLRRLPKTPLQELVERVFAEEEWSEEDLRFNPLSNNEDLWLPQRV